MENSVERRPWQRHFFEGANCRLSAIDYGNETNPAMVILHGMRDHAVSMTSIAEAFADNYRVVVPDLRGHGESDNSGSYTMVQFVADVKALIRYFNLEEVTLIGHSLGGHITSKYTAIFPEDVAALVLIDGMGPPRQSENVDLTMQRERWREHIESALSISSDRPPMPDAAAALSRLERNNPKLAKTTGQLIVNHGIEPHPEGGVRWKFDPAVNMVWSTFDHAESEMQWTMIECPVMIITGEESMRYWARRNLSDQGAAEDLHSRETERRRRLFKNARHEVIAGAGHMIHYDEPDALNRVLGSFLRDI